MSDLLYHSAAHIVRDAIAGLGGGTFPADNKSWPMFINNEPDRPDNCITVYDTRRYYQHRMMRGGDVDEAFGIQIRVRASTVFLGANKVNSLAKIVDTLIHAVIVIVASDPGTGGLPAVPYRIVNFSRRSIGLSGGRGSNNYYLGKERRPPSTNDLVSFSNRDIFSLSGKVTIRMA